MNSYIFLIIVLVVVLAILVIATFTRFQINDEQYDRLKWVALHWDVLVVFIALVVKLFDVPYGIETVSLVAGIGAALGGLLGVSNVQYKKATQIQTTFNDDSYEEMKGVPHHEDTDITAEQ